MKHELLDIISSRQIKKDLPLLRSGDVVKVHFLSFEKDKKTGAIKKRVQFFEGLVIKISGEGCNKTFTVRKVFENIGIEKTFSLYSQLIEKIEILKHLKVRRAKLFYMRDKKYKNNINKV